MKKIFAIIIVLITSVSAYCQTTDVYYTYDALGRITMGEVIKDDTYVQTTVYSYDELGNRTAKVVESAPILYEIQVSSMPSDGGIVSGAGNYEAGQTCTLVASPNSSYVFTNYTENGTEVSTNITYTFTVTGNRNLVANFTQNVHTITATAGANGTINPSGMVTVAEGGSQTFEINPNAGYDVYEVYVDGTLVGSMSTFTFSKVMADHNIFATFQHVEGIGENMNSEIAIYPNPTNGILNAQCPEIDEIRVYNVFGELIAKTKTNGSNLMQIDLSKVPSGIYLLQAIRDNELVSKVFIKE